MYPIFYYFLGAYLAKYPVKMGVKLNIVLLIFFALFDGIFNFCHSFSSTYIFGGWNDYPSATIMIITSLMFNLLLKIKSNKKIRILPILINVVYNLFIKLFKRIRPCIWL